MNEAHTADLLAWLRTALAAYVPEAIAIYRAGTNQNFPTHASNEGELQVILGAGGHFLPLPKEPAALANIIEVAVVDYLARTIQSLANATIVRGTERGYPDIEISGDAFGGGYHAVDIKVARRAKGGSRLRVGLRCILGTHTFGIHN